MYLHLIKILLASNIWFLIMEGYLTQTASIMHLLIWIMNTLYFVELIGSLYWRFEEVKYITKEGHKQAHTIS